MNIRSTLPSAVVGAPLLLMAAHFDLSVIAIATFILLLASICSRPNTKKNTADLVWSAAQVRTRQGGGRIRVHGVGSVRTLSGKAPAVFRICTPPIRMPPMQS